MSRDTCCVREPLPSARNVGLVAPERECACVAKDTEAGTLRRSACGSKEPRMVEVGVVHDDLDE